MDRKIAELEEYGYITSAFGRKLWMYKSDGYMSCNYYVQGSGADMVKKSMLQIDRYLKKSGADAKMILTIHDEIILEVRREHLTKSFVLDIMEIMGNHPELTNLKRIPVNLSIVENSWEHKKEIENLEELDNVSKIKACR